MNGIAKVLDAFNEQMQQHNRIDCLNVMLVGISGSGKTLLGEVLCELRTTEPPYSNRKATDQIENMKKLPHDHLQLIDTPGFDPYNYTAIIRLIQNYITDRNSSHDYRKHIHFALLCVPESRQRFEDGEMNLLQMLINCDVAPIIVVTVSMNDQQSSAFISELRRIVSPVGSIPIVSILAADYKLMNNYIVEAHGIDKLKATIAGQTDKTLMEAVARSKKPVARSKKHTYTDDFKYSFRSGRKTTIAVVVSMAIFLVLIIYYSTIMITAIDNSDQEIHELTDNLK